MVKINLVLKHEILEVVNNQLRWKIGTGRSINNKIADIIEVKGRGKREEIVKRENIILLS